jgi:CRP-like cAMP-binding protein
MNMNDESRLFTAKAMKDCELLVLSKSVKNNSSKKLFQDLYAVQQEFPDIVEELLANAQKRLERTLEVKEEAIAFSKSNQKISDFKSKVCLR